ncbi:unnamed protein product [Arctogadus glacialis]
MDQNDHVPRIVTATRATPRAPPPDGAEERRAGHSGHQVLAYDADAGPNAWLCLRAAAGQRNADLFKVAPAQRRGPQPTPRDEDNSTSFSLTVLCATTASALISTLHHHLFLGFACPRSRRRTAHHPAPTAHCCSLNVTLYLIVALSATTFVFSWSPWWCWPSCAATLLHHPVLLLAVLRSQAAPDAGNTRSVSWAAAAAAGGGVGGVLGGCWSASQQQRVLAAGPEGGAALHRGAGQRLADQDRTATRRALTSTSAATPSFTTNGPAHQASAPVAAARALLHLHSTAAFVRRLSMPDKLPAICPEVGAALGLLGLGGWWLGARSGGAGGAGCWAGVEFSVSGAHSSVKAE